MAQVSKYLSPCYQSTRKINTQNRENFWKICISKVLSVLFPLKLTYPLDFERYEFVLKYFGAALTIGGNPLPKNLISDKTMKFAANSADLLEASGLLRSIQVLLKRLRLHTEKLNRKNKGKICVICRHSSFIQVSSCISCL